MSRTKGPRRATKIATGAIVISMFSGVVPAQAVAHSHTAPQMPQASSLVPQAVRFTDTARNPFRTEIQWLADKGITTGYPDGTFRPTQPINRDAMAAFLYRMAGKPAYTAPKTSRFKDVRPGQAFYKEIHWLAAKGITTGYSDGTFRPGQPINRGSMAAFLYRYAGQPAFTAPKTSRFKDLRPGQAFYKEIHWLAARNITTGYQDRTFGPAQPIARDAMAAFLYRYSHPRWNAPKPNPGKVTYMANMAPSAKAYDFEYQTAEIRGKTYASSITNKMWELEQEGIAYTLSGKYDRLRATLGLDDRSEDSSALYRVQIYGDNRIIATKDVRFNNAVDLDVSVAGVGHLFIEVTRMDGRGSSTLVLGSPRVYAGVVPKPSRPAPSAPRTDYLSQTDAVNGDYGFEYDPVSIGGTYYQSSVLGYVSSEKPKVIEYNLGRTYTTFRTTVGLSDVNRDSAARYQVNFYVDGQRRASAITALNDRRDIVVPVRDGLRLKIEVTRLYGSGYSTSIVALGNARLEY